MKRRISGFHLLPVALALVACGRSANEVSFEERVYLTLRHDPPAWLQTGEEGYLEVEVEGNMVLDPGALVLFTATTSDTGWSSQPFYPGELPGIFRAAPPSGRSGETFAYFVRARTPSGGLLFLPADLNAGQQPYESRWRGRIPAVLGFLMWSGIVLTVLCFLGAGFTAWKGLQRRGEPGAIDQARLARWVAAGAVMLLASAGLLGAIHSWTAWGAPYRGFPFGDSAMHSKVLLLMIIWGALSWSAWGSLTRRTGARDRLPPRLYAGMVLAALLITLLLVLLPDAQQAPQFPPLTLTGA